MQDPTNSQFTTPYQEALRKLAALLESVASLIDSASRHRAEIESGAPDSMTDEPTRKMPALERETLAASDALHRVIGSIVTTPIREDEIPLPEIKTVKIPRPEPMAELMEKLRQATETVIVEVEPLGPITQKMAEPEAAHGGVPPGVRNPESFGRSHPKHPK